MNQIVQNIDLKVRSIISRYKKILDENKKIKSNAIDLENDVKEKNKKIKELEEKIKLLKIARSVNSKELENVKASRKKINEYVREIDKCVALLNK